MTTAPEELKLKVTEFDGTRSTSNRWLHSITAYLDINDRKYDSDKKKVIFATSFMTKGAAAKWSEDFLEHSQTIRTPLPSWQPTELEPCLDMELGWILKESSRKHSLPPTLKEMPWRHS
jgi:hypothetical protein